MVSSFLMTCHPDHLDHALNELRQPTVLGRDLGLSGQLLKVHTPSTFAYQFDASTASVIAAMAALDPCFIRHMHPILGTLPTATLHEAAFPALDASALSLQINSLDSSIDVAPIVAALESQLRRLGHTVDPQAETVLSLTLTPELTYWGSSLASQNLSPWPAGRVRLRRFDDQLSRAGFKLEEALAHFAFHPEPTTAIDLGAAPGSWTQVLLREGWSVIAIDPAKLDPKLRQHPQVTNIEATSETYLQDLQTGRTTPPPIGLIVNDMKMDVAASAQLTVELAQQLGGPIPLLLTFKLPSKGAIAKIREGVQILQSAGYTDLRAKQLHHNRTEITLFSPAGDP